MKANRAIKNERAEVGVGTLIVFIAMVLVAAVAAAVLINTTGTLQQRAQSTGKEATQEVSSNLKVVNVYGIKDAASGKLDEIAVHVQLSAGALPMDLEQLILRYSDGTNTFNMVYTEAFDDAGVCDGAGTPVVPTVDAQFVTKWLRPSPTTGNDLGCSGASVMEAGDLVELHFGLDDAPDHRLPVRTDVTVSIIPESGTSVQADFKTPSTYGDDTYLTLR